MILDLFKLDGRVVLVTGGRRGLGRAMACALAQAGADVACVSKTGRAGDWRQVVAAGRRFLDIRADLAEPAQRRGLVDRVARRAGRRGYSCRTMRATQHGTCRRIIPRAIGGSSWRSHLNAAFDLSQQAAPGMFERGRGKIINIGSVMSFEGGLNIPAYAAAKHGIAGLTKSLAVAWSGRVDQRQLHRPRLFRDEHAHSLQNHPVRGQQILDRILRAVGHARRAGGLAVFLASDASNYMHGSVVPIDGGWLAR